MVCIPVLALLLNIPLQIEYFFIFIENFKISGSIVKVFIHWTILDIYNNQ
jgi:hypothetical protein